MSEEPRLVGRDGELTVLRAELDRARRGELRCVLLTGEPGWARPGWPASCWPQPVATALSARAYALGATSEFGLWAEALERHLAAAAVEEDRLSAVLVWQPPKPLGDVA